MYRDDDENTIMLVQEWAAAGRPRRRHPVGAAAWVLPFVHSPMMVAITLTTTPLGLLHPILRDSGELDTPFGRQVLAAGVAGEFDPIVVMSLMFAHDYTPWEEAPLMLAFVALSVLCALVARRGRPPRLIAFLARVAGRNIRIPLVLTPCRGR